MASAALDSLERPGWFSRSMVLLVWLPIVVIGTLHYATGSEHHWAHDILRRLYYLPIVLAAFLRGLRGGLAAAVVISVSYLPHAFIHPVHFDPATGTEKVLELVLYHVVGGVAGYLADLERRRRTELHNALAEQRRLTRQLVRAGRLSALGEVVAGMAHEIKNPLHALQGTAEIVDPLIPAGAEERRLWDLHVAELERLERVAERFLSFARPSPLEMSSHDLREVARRLFELVDGEARQQDIRLTTELPDDPVPILGDRDQLAQVGLNIALNGFKALAGRKAAHMVIRVGASGEGMSFLCLENNGPSIPEEELEHIFDPFTTGDDETGTGLGLSISARIVEQHAGYLEAENVDAGVRFTVFLPREPVEAAAG